MTTTIFDLPRDLLNEIISRVPFKFMRAKRLAFWRYLAITTSMEKESQMMIMLKNDTLYFASVTVNENPSIEPLGKLTCLKDWKQVKISRVFYCDGLLLCILKEDDTKVLVWNPYSGQKRWINQRYSHWGQNSYTYALGYVNKNNRRSYKILSFLWYDIYDFDTDSWKALDVTPQWKISFVQNGGVSLKGNTYWCARKSNSSVDEDEELDDHIICFDFTSERFGPLMRLPFTTALKDSVTLSCVREEKLAVLLTHNVINLELWITTKIETEKLTWSKFLTLNMEPHDHPISSRFFLVEEEKKLAIGFSCSSDHCTLSIVGEDGYLRLLDLGDNYHGSKYVCSYVPSLVQIKQGKGEKRKRENESRFTSPNAFYSL